MELINPFMSFGGVQAFHVATDGDDGNPGTEAEPWATLTFAVDQLQAGDTLIVGGGTYHETVAVTANGTEENPITIVAADGETPIVDGSLSAYRTSGNSAWENVSGNLWRTVATLPDPGEFGYTGRIKEGGSFYMLTSYNDTGIATGLDSLSAVDDLYDPDNPYYMGPGITYNSGRVYIRLDPNSSDAHWDAITPFAFGDVDPRTHEIYIQANNTGVSVDGDWVVVDGLTINHVWTGVGGTGTNVTIQNVTMRPSRFGARVGAADWTFDNVTMNFDRPSWIARSDVKAGAEPAKDTRTGGLAWETSGGGLVQNCTIVGPFDGLLVLSNTVGLSILDTTLDDCMDDGVQLGSAAYDFEFGRNLVTGSGVSHDGSGSDAADTPDSVYLHHNVFDNTGTVFWARKPIVGVDPSENGDGGYLSPPPIGSHAVPDFDDPWKIYNNTFVAVASPGLQGVNHYAYHGSSPGEGIHEAYNNLLNLQTGDTRVYRNANASTGLEAYDYNIYARNSTPALGQFAIDSIDENGTPQAVTTDFATWQAQMGTFDAHSIHQTSQVTLNGSYQPAIGGPADGNGTDLSGTGWPGTTPGTTYIGAKEPV